MSKCQNCGKESEDIFCDRDCALEWFEDHKDEIEQKCVEEGVHEELMMGHTCERCGYKRPRIQIGFKRDE